MNVMPMKIFFFRRKWITPFELTAIRMKKRPARQAVPASGKFIMQSDVFVSGVLDRKIEEVTLEELQTKFDYIGWLYE